VVGLEDPIHGLGGVGEAVAVELAVGVDGDRRVDLGECGVAVVVVLEVAAEAIGEEAPFLEAGEVDAELAEVLLVGFGEVAAAVGGAVAMGRENVDGASVEAVFAGEEEDVPLEGAAEAA